MSHHVHFRVSSFGAYSIYVQAFDHKHKRTVRGGTGLQAMVERDSGIKVTDH
jgi:hypothetical protein